MRPMSPKVKYRPPGALQILDEAVYLLRSGSGKLLPAYYIGSLPFVLGLLYFWADMSRAADASGYLGASSLGMALLFVWMKCWQSIFAIRTRDYILGQTVSAWTVRRVSDLIAVQTLVHASAFVVLPVAMVLVLPFGWCYAFYQNATAAPAADRSGFGATCRYAWRQAALSPRENHLLLAVWSLFSAAVLIDLALAVFMLPYLIKKFFGIETLFTLSGFNAVNTTFLAAVFSLAYLCLDPIVKTAYGLRCFHGESLATGTDIKTELYQCVSQQRSA